MEVTHETGDVRQVIERLETIASHQGCHGPFDENCYAYPERMSEWCAPCIMGAAHKLLTAQSSEVERQVIFRAGWIAHKNAVSPVRQAETPMDPVAAFMEFTASHPTQTSEVEWLKAELTAARREIDTLRKLKADLYALNGRLKASQPAPSGWQQRIAAMDPWRMVADQSCFFCHRERYKVPFNSHAPDCLWQNAVDALPPAPDATVKCSHCGDGGVIPTKDGPFCATCYHPLAADASPVKEERYPLLWERGETIRSVPIDLARRAYEGYSKAYGTQQSFERLRERGGFGPSEMDRFVPGWRDDPRVKEVDASPKEPR